MFFAGFDQHTPMRKCRWRSGRLPIVWEIVKISALKSFPKREKPTLFTTLVLFYSLSSSGLDTAVYR
jgi:hypothetical protein